MRRPLFLVPPLIGLIAVAAFLIASAGGGDGDASDDPAVAVSSPRATASPAVTASPTPTPTPPPTPAERYAAAIAARDAGELDAAAAGLEGVAESEGVLAPFARFRLAQVLAQAGDHEGAVAAYALAVGDPALPRTLLPIGERELAASLVELERYVDALVELDRVVDDLTLPASDRTFARWSRAQVLLSMEDPTWSDDAITIVLESPGHPVASFALDELELAEIEPPALSAAYVRYLARQNDAATERYEAILEDEPDEATAGVAWFYLGALAERAPDRPGAIEAYGESLAADPLGSKADDAAYWRGRVAEEEGDFEAAAEYYDVLLSEYPSSNFVADGALRGALATIDAGDVEGGLARLEAIVLEGGIEAASAARWYEVAAGAEARAAAGLPAASEIDGRSLAAILERAGDSALEPPPMEPLPMGSTDGGEVDVNAVEEWLLGQYGASIPAPTAGDALFDEIAPQLIDAGERSLARALILERLDDTTSESAWINVSLRSIELGLRDVGLIGAMRVLVREPTEARLENPAVVEQLGYPAPWPELVEAAAEEFEVPPLLLLALARQESAFEPDVVSPAGAIGLTQVIPPTGVQIASALGEPWGGGVSLTDPETSLRYGAAYLAEQLETFDGNVFAALAAYNAGPINAQRWLDAQVAPGADAFVRAIDFEETRRYVASVVEQYAWYRYVYGASDAPSITPDTAGSGESEATAGATADTPEEGTNE